MGGGMSFLMGEMAGAPLNQAPESSKPLCQDARGSPSVPIFKLPPFSAFLPYCPLEGFWLPQWGHGSLGTGAQTVGSC